jgi:hypothetical protein
MVARLKITPGAGSPYADAFHHRVSAEERRL